MGESVQLAEEFIKQLREWIVEGCYGNLLEVVARRRTLLIFLNPGVEYCLANNRQQPWEPHKYSSAKAQREKLGLLQQWVREYPTRGDEYSLKRHREIFDACPAPKVEVIDSDSLYELESMVRLHFPEANGR